MEKLFIYTRVSSDDQTENSPEVQKQKGIEAAERNGFSYVEMDEGASSSKHEDLSNRPVMKELLQLASEGKVKHLFVQFINRLSRNDQVSGNIKYILSKNKVTLYTEEGKYNFDNNSDRLIFDVLTAVSEYDNKTRAAAVSSGIDRAVTRGIFPGTSPYGYKRVNKRLVIEEQEEKVVKRIFEMCIDGKGQTAIAKILDNEGVPTKAEILTKKYNEENKELIDSIYSKKTAGEPLNYHDNLVIRRANRTSTWSNGSIQTIYSNRVYIGEYSYRGNIYKVVPPIISIKIFTDAEKARRNHSTSWDNPNKSRFSMLKGMMHCSCGMIIGVIARERFSNYYYCGSERKKNRGGYCGLPRVNQVLINNLVWNVFIDSGNLYVKIYKEAQENGIDLDSIRKVLQKNINSAEMQIKLQTDKLERAEMKYLDEEVSQKSYFRQKDVFQSQIERLTGDVKNYKIELEDASTTKESPITDFIKSIRKIQKEADPVKKREILQTYVEKIILSHDGEQFQIELHMKYNKFVDGYWLKDQAVINSKQYYENFDVEQYELSEAMYNRQK